MKPMQDIKQCKECGHENPKKFMGKEYTSHAPNCPQDIKQTLWVIIKTMCDCESEIPEHCTRFNAINSVLSFAVKQERKKVVEEIQAIADTTPPNLLLNEIVSKI